MGGSAQRLIAQRFSYEQRFRPRATWCSLRCAPLARRQWCSRPLAGATVAPRRPTAPAVRLVDPGGTLATARGSARPAGAPAEAVGLAPPMNRPARHTGTAPQMPVNPARGLTNIRRAAPAHRAGRYATPAARRSAGTVPGAPPPCPLRGALRAGWPRTWAGALGPLIAPPACRTCGDARDGRACHRCLRRAMPRALPAPHAALRATCGARPALALAGACAARHPPPCRGAGGWRAATAPVPGPPISRIGSTWAVTGRFRSIGFLLRDPHGDLIERPAARGRPQPFPVPGALRAGLTPSTSR